MMDNPCQSGPISRTERERTINLGGNRNARSGSEGTSAGDQRGPAAPCSREKTPRQEAQPQKDKKHDKKSPDPSCARLIALQMFRILHRRRECRCYQLKTRAS